MRIQFILISAAVLLAGCTYGEVSVDPVFIPVSSSSLEDAIQEPQIKKREISNISLTAEYPVYAPDIQQISFLLENHTDEDLIYGLDRSLEYRSQGNWEPVPLKSNAINSIGLLLPSGESRAVTINTLSYNWDWRKGDYRLIQPASSQKEDQKLYAEFSIGDSHISGSTPYGFMKLEDIPSPYPRELSDADGVIYNFHGKLQSNEDKILDFFQKVAYQFPAMIRIESITIEGDPIYTDIEYHPEKNAFCCFFDSTRDRFGSENQITSAWYPFFQIEETNGELGLVLSEWRSPQEGQEGSTNWLPFYLSQEKKTEFLQANQKIQERYNLNPLIQCTFSPSGERWAAILDKERIAVQIPGNGYTVSAEGRKVDYLKWQDESLLEIWDENSQYWVYDTGKKEFIHQISVCGLPPEPKS